MFETCRILGTSLDLDRVLDDAITKIVTLLDPWKRGSFISSIRAAGHWRACAPPSGRQITADPNQRRTAHSRRLSAPLTRGRPAYVTNPQSAMSIIGVPLFSQERPVGALCLAHRAAFSNYPVIQTLARQLGIAIENARLYAEVQEKEILRGLLLQRAVAAQGRRSASASPANCTTRRANTDRAGSGTEWGRRDHYPGPGTGALSGCRTQDDDDARDRQFAPVRLGPPASLLDDIGARVPPCAG